ncbi:MAG TPA: hypothetical protein ENN32_03615 [Chloroflexi bacterium]|nr:hypothetical protein [Chloroflexota bacterium]
MSSDFVFHVRNAQPGDMIAILATLEDYPGLSTIAEIVDQADTLGFTIRDRARLEALMTARELDFVEMDKNLLTDKGKALVRLEMNKPDLFPDIVHGYQYTLWDKKKPSIHCFSWTYREICKHLWQLGSYHMDSQGKKDLTSEIEGLARTHFERSDIALSAKSVGGAFLWIEELVPGVINQPSELFARRTFCPPELFILGVNFVYRGNEMDYGTNLLLGEEPRNTICQICLLEPDGFDRVLDYATAQFDYLEKGIGGGWGQYLTLYRAPVVEDFV